MKLFDWKQVCAEDVSREFPPVAGKGRGKPLEEAVKEARAARKLRNQRPAELTEEEPST